MSRYLFGPVTRAFAEQNVKRFREEGSCLAFNAEGDVDLQIGPADDWQTIRGRLPQGWLPDYLVLNLPYSTIPEGLWSAPLPRIALASDWNLLWHAYRHALPSADLVLTDAPGRDSFEREGLGPVWAANLCGCERLFIDQVAAGGSQGETARDIDILFLGNLNPAVQKERAAWLGRIAQLARSHRVLIQTGVFGETCLRLLQRAKIVFQFSDRGKLGRRSFEAAAAGALIFQEAENRELFKVLEPARECVAYQPENLTRLVEYYLEHEEERRRLTAAAKQKVATLTYEHLWGELSGRIEAEWGTLRDGAGRVFTPEGIEQLQLRCWQALGSLQWDDLTLVRDLERAAREPATASWTNNALGVMLARQAQALTGVPTQWEVAVDCLRKAAGDEFALAGLNLAQALSSAGKRPQAVDWARRTLLRLLSTPTLDKLSLDGLPLCLGYDAFRVEWERCGFAHAGRPEQEAAAKRQLILWQLYSLLTRWTGEAEPAYEAAILRPELPSSRLLVGDALVRVGRQVEAAEHFRRAIEANPLDREAAHRYFLALEDIGDKAGQDRLREDRRLLARSAPGIVPTEPWFAEARPKGNELVSVIVSCGTDAERTRRCLESVRRYSRPPYELILVPSGSGAAELLTEFQKSIRTPRALAPERLEVIPLRRERGPQNPYGADHFAHANGDPTTEPVQDPDRPRDDRVDAAGVNQALARARGRYLVLLDDAVVATPGWLDGLVKWALHDWPAIGMVGPVLNGGPEPQGLRDAPSTPEDVNAFAARRRRDFTGCALDTRRLNGACLFARREVFDLIGGLDERFPPDLFGDDDWSLRALEAGFRLFVAQDVFVYHSGPPLLIGNPGAYPRLRENFERFRAKWGPDRTAGYALPPDPNAPPEAPVPEQAPATEPGQSEAVPAAPALSPDDPSRPKVSLCMIVRNEEHHLPDCLRSVAGLFDEMVVVDTGSADRTREVASEFGAKIFDFPWPDSFGAARNVSLGHARGKWIMWLDADDRLDDENRQRLKEVLAGLGDERDAYAVKVRSVLDATRTGFRLLDQVRLFRNLPEVRWEYRIHEQILPAVNRAGGGVRWTPIVVDHVGYQDAEVRRKKLDRNLRLLEMDADERPEDSFSLFNLGWTLLDLGRAEEAFPRLQRSFDKAATHSSILRKLYHLLSICHRTLGRVDESLEVCRKGLAAFPDDGEMLLEQGMMLRDRGDLLGAERSWLKLLLPRQGNYFGSEEVGLRGYRTRLLLAELYAHQQRWLEAEIQFRAALAERADFEPAWMGLADILLRPGRDESLEELLRQLDFAGVSPAKVGWLRARGQMRRQEFSTARYTLEVVIAQDPHAIGPRILYSHALLQEGRDWSAAERALRDVLERDPNHQESQHNLQLLLRNRSRNVTPAGAV